MQTHTIEVWDGDDLVAGEVGISVGQIYMSLTGFCHQSGAGTVQLQALGRLLGQLGFKLWDLGQLVSVLARLILHCLPSERGDCNPSSAQGWKCSIRWTWGHV